MRDFCVGVFPNWLALFNSSLFCWFTFPKCSLLIVHSYRFTQESPIFVRYQGYEGYGVISFKLLNAAKVFFRVTPLFYCCVCVCVCVCVCIHTTYCWPCYIHCCILIVNSINKKKKNIPTKI
jgi:hypothetical protein